MYRNQFRQLSRLRLREARLLLQAGAFPGAYYLAGYAIECALKACIANQFDQHDIPIKQFVNDIYTHDLDRLLNLAGLREALKKDATSHPTLQTNWNVVKDWKETSRYDATVEPKRARDLYSACAARQYGILAWLKVRW